MLLTLREFSPFCEQLVVDSPIYLSMEFI